MTKTNALAALADRCESATGPCDDLDGAIYTAITGLPAYIEMQGRRGLSKDVPRYSASLDAALTLVPEGFYWELTLGTKAGKRGEIGPYWSEIYDDKMLRTGNEIHVGAATPALALCAAALRAAIADMEADHGR